jgi:hypothetical protein
MHTCLDILLLQLRHVLPRCCSTAQAIERKEKKKGNRWSNKILKYNKIRKAKLEICLENA